MGVFLTLVLSIALVLLFILFFLLKQHLDFLKKQNETNLELVKSEVELLSEKKLTEELKKYVSDLENSNESYQKFYEGLSTKIVEDYERIKQLDRLGSFQADDEVGFIFNSIKQYIEGLRDVLNEEVI